MDDNIELEGMFESLSDTEKMILLDGMTFGLGFIGLVSRYNSLCDEVLFIEETNQMMAGLRVGVMQKKWGLYQIILAVHGLLHRHKLIVLPEGEEH